jgi:hypothetical protein
VASERFVIYRCNGVRIVVHHLVVGQRHGVAACIFFWRRDVDPTERFAVAWFLFGLGHWSGCRCGSGTGGAASMQRALTELRLAECGGVSGEPLLLAESILQLRIGTDGLSYRRGAVVGNVVFWAALAAAAVVLVQQRARGVLRRGGETLGLWEAAGALHLPGWLIVVYVPLLQPTVTSSVTLLLRPSADVLLGLFGLAVCAAPAAWSVHIVALRRPFPAVAKPATGDLSASPLPRLLLSQRCGWRDRARGSGFVRHYGALFEEHVGGRQWFVAVDLSAEVLMGLLGALVGLPQQQVTRCQGLKAASVGVTASFLLAVVSLRPSNKLLDAVITTSNAAVGAAGAVAVLVSADVGPPFALAQGIFAAASVLLSLGELHSAGRALRWLWAAVRGRARGAAAPRRRAGRPCDPCVDAASPAVDPKRHGTTAPSPAMLRRLIPLLRMVASLRGCVVHRSEVEQRMALAMLVGAVCRDKVR